jgi:phosphoribosylglycinamide formyltransferase 1
MVNIAVFGSGRGSNFLALLRAIDDGRITGARIVLVGSNNSTAGILDIARSHSLPAVHLSLKQYASEDQFTDALLAKLHALDTGLIVLAGYMKRIPARIVAAYRGKILNIHPALLPKYGGQGMFGIHVHEAVIASGDTESGATVHLVDELYDHGRIVLQKKVPVFRADTPETLAARVLDIEHEIYPLAVKQFIEETSGATETHVTVLERVAER